MAERLRRQPRRQLPLALPGTRLRHIYSGELVTVAEDQTPRPLIPWLYDGGVAIVNVLVSGGRQLVPMYLQTLVEEEA